MILLLIFFNINDLIDILKKMVMGIYGYAGITITRCLCE